MDVVLGRQGDDDILAHDEGVVDIVRGHGGYDSSFVEENIDDYTGLEEVGFDPCAASVPAC